jgi:hypothetical protein
MAALQVLRGKGADISEEAEEIQVTMCLCVRVRYIMTFPRAQY